MADPTSRFTVVRRGYDPDEVDQLFAEFARAIKELAAQRDQLAVQLTSRPGAAATAPVVAPAEPVPATFEHLGERVSQILSLARDEADDLRSQAASEGERTIAEARRKADEILDEATSLAAQVSSDSAREVAAATQHRDSIDAQLANVQQMLATLTSQPEAIRPETAAD